MPDFCPDERVKVATNVGSLAQLCFRGGGTLQTKHTGLCGEHLQWMDHTEVATAPGSMHLPSPSCSGSWGHREDTVPGGLCISLGELVSGYDTAGRYEPSRTQEDVVSGWQPAQCLVGSMVPGAAVAICLSPLAVLHLSLCLQGEPQTAALLCYL